MAYVCAAIMFSGPLHDCMHEQNKDDYNYSIKNKLSCCTL